MFSRGVFLAALMVISAIAAPQDDCKVPIFGDEFVGWGLVAINNMDIANSQVMPRIASCTNMDLLNTNIGLGVEDLDVQPYSVVNAGVGNAHLTIENAEVTGEISTDTQGITVAGVTIHESFQSPNRCEGCSSTNNCCAPSNACELCDTNVTGQEPIAWNPAYSCVRARSAALASQYDTGIKSISNGIISLSFDNSLPAGQVQYISLSQEEITSAQGIMIGFAPSDPIVVNVAGNALDLQNLWFGGGNNNLKAYGSNLLWNFHNTSGSLMVRSWYGSILAPRFTTSMRNGEITGNVISFNLSLENYCVFSGYDFEPCIFSSESTCFSA